MKKTKPIPPTTLSSEASANTVEVTRKKMKSGPGSPTIRKRAEQIMEQVGCERCELSIVLCDDSFIQELNRSYRNKDKPTDVLSFPMIQDAHTELKDALLGDVIISIDTASRQAQSRNHSLLTEVTTLLIHGILHLIGYTHENDDDESRMNRMASQLLKIF